MKPPKPRRKRETRPLSDVDWIDAALRVMVQRGVSNVRIEVLAKDLKVTKGSFYWHFKSRAALLDAMLNRYQRLATDYIRSCLQTGKSPEARLRIFLESSRGSDSQDDTARMELAFRLWSRRSPQVRKAVAKMDRQRIGYISELLEAFCNGRPKVRAYSYLVKALVFYLWTVDTTTNTDRKQLINLCLTLVRTMRIPRPRATNA